MLVANVRAIFTQEGGTSLLRRKDITVQLFILVIVPAIPGSTWWIQ